MLISKKLKSTDLKPNTSIALHLSGILQFAYHLKKKKQLISIDRAGIIKLIL